MRVNLFSGVRAAKWGHSVGPNVVPFWFRFSSACRAIPVNIQPSESAFTRQWQRASILECHVKSRYITNFPLTTRALSILTLAANKYAQKFMTCFTLDMDIHHSILQCAPREDRNSCEVLVISI